MLVLLLRLSHGVAGAGCARVIPHGDCAGSLRIQHPRDCCVHRRLLRLLVRVPRLLVL